MKNTITLRNGAMVDIYLPNTEEAKGFVLYLHGGGMIYGTKNDLTSEVKELFLNQQYGILAVDYLLAPNHLLSEILSVLDETFLILKETYIRNLPFGICGRSAGGFLMMHLTKRISDFPPAFLVNFYGYTDLEFIHERKNLISQVITESMITGIDRHTTVWDDPLLTRYPLYHYALQQDLLAKFYGVTTTNAKEFALTEQELVSFPPCFSTASISDQEIPFHYSKNLAKWSRNSLFIPLYYLPHDFLKEAHEVQVKEMFTRLEKWLVQFN